MSEEYIPKIRNGEQRLQEEWLLCNRSKSQLVSMVLDRDEQIQAHNEKEDKLREYIDNPKRSMGVEVEDWVNDGDEPYFEDFIPSSDILQILDGSDE